MDDDFLLAVRLQEQFDDEYDTSLFSSNGFEGGDLAQSSKKRRVEVAGGGGDVAPYRKPAAPRPERPLSIVDASWEMLDPSPDVRAMFLEFNTMFFWGKLSGVEVKWSPRMTLCAGVCSYEGRGGLCSIRLSEPLLKLRPRKDLVETLLHEMIHALLFVTQNNRDRDGHGPEFCKHMNRINGASGTKITVYHSFHDEVDAYRQHWWRCDGPCRSRKPYLGFVKRAMNRAPSSLDLWWEDHRRTCGGTYAKVKEPEGYGKKGKKDGKAAEARPSGNGKPPGSGLQDIRNMIPFSGKGFLLGGKSQTPAPPPVAVSPPKNFPAPSSAAKTLASPTEGTPAAKKSSVGDTRAFVSVDGSPVKIPKTRGGGGKIKQRSIEELFNGRKSAFDSPKTSAGAASASSEPNSNKSSRSAVSTGSKPTPSKYSGASGTSGGPVGGPTSRKGPPGDDITGSAAVFDLFRRTPGRDSAAKSASSSSSSTSLSSSSSSSSSAPTVSCPVCRAKVPEPKINEHLDSCLS
ncbi:DNA-dependent metalloprotease SPRTN [Brachyistius frenatus]|uniref:DNA-dependent metalloprotease SPRTN n=1 Tax=Brachyistius frenatus TaxID=100188 RepID=UPI0037E935F0